MDMQYSGGVPGGFGDMSGGLNGESDSVHERSKIAPPAPVDEVCGYAQLKMNSVHLHIRRSSDFPGEETGDVLCAGDVFKFTTSGSTTYSHTDGRIFEVKYYVISPNVGFVHDLDIGHLENKSSSPIIKAITQVEFSALNALQMEAAVLNFAKTKARLQIMSANNDSGNSHFRGFMEPGEIVLFKAGPATNATGCELADGRGWIFYSSENFSRALVPEMLQYCLKSGDLIATSAVVNVIVKTSGPERDPCDFMKQAFHTERFGGYSQYSGRADELFSQCNSFLSKWANEPAYTPSPMYFANKPEASRNSWSVHNPKNTKIQMYFSDHSERFVKSWDIERALWEDLFDLSPGRTEAIMACLKSAGSEDKVKTRL